MRYIQKLFTGIENQNTEIADVAIFDETKLLQLFTKINLHFLIHSHLSK
jgi:hypothetical protein